MSRVAAHDERTLGEAIADRAAAGIGSWRFIVIQTALVAVWTAANITGIVFRWDPYPFILLNLMFSVQAAYCGPILLLAGNRQAQRDRSMAERDDEELGELLDLQRKQWQMLTRLEVRIKRIEHKVGT